MKKATLIMAAGMALFMIGCGPKDNKQVPVTTDTVVTETPQEPVAAEPTPVDFSACDMAMLDNGKLYLYNTKTSSAIPVEVETDSVVNIAFVNNTLYYCVPEGKMIVLKSLQLDELGAKPQKVADWGLEYEKCVSETYGTVSPLEYYPNRNMLGLWHEFSWDVYSLFEQKLYNLGDGTVTDWNRQDMGTDVEENPIIYNFDQRKDQYWYKDGNTRVCLTDKIDFSPYVSDPEYASDREYSIISMSPDNSKVLYMALLEWGDMAHGILAVSSIDGKVQIPLEDTDCTGYIADWLDDGSLVYVGEMPLSPDDPDYDANWHYRTHCIKRIYPDGTSDIISNCGDFKVKKN